ncbi:hypothetical protein GGI07_003733 [Coemansia sp. Benny D115]|nr:hypothetical protein GGI07_003733 [Coemansia sp. Benny D115]
MDKALNIDDSQPLVPRGFNLDTILRYTSRTLRSPLLSYLAVKLATRRITGRTFTPKDEAAATAALWATTSVALPAICKLAARLLTTPTNVHWAGEIVVVTGGSNGIGLELTKRLLRAHARVAIIDVNPCALAEDKRFAERCRYYACDITDVEAVKKTAVRIREELGDPTMLVNNAGIVVGKLLLDMSDKEVNKVIDVNLTAHFHLIRQFLPAMIAANRGHIVSIGSIVSFAGTPQASTYCASKGGVKLLHESLRREVASRYKCENIQFTIAFPGVINTGLFTGTDCGQFLLPTLRPDTIARAVFAALDSGKGQEIYLPKVANLLTIIYAFPQGLRGHIVNLFGRGDDAMSAFSGHTKYAV